MYSKKIRVAASIGIMSASMAGCAKHDAATPDSTATTASSTSSSTAPAASAHVMPTDISPVRGVIASVSDSALDVTTMSGTVHVAIAAPLHVFQRGKSDLAHVSAKSFVGVTSVKQADGSQVATEIHIFPEELRGTGEGSYLMTAPAGAHDSARSTMTNGTVEAPKSDEAPRMTNGAVSSTNGKTLVVDYHGGSQTIKVPADVKVTSLEPASAKLATGAKVVVLAKKQADGTMKASSVVLAAEPGK